MHDALSPKGLCSTIYLNNQLEELHTTDRNLFNLSNLRVSVYLDLKSILGKFQFIDDLTMPQELNDMPNLKSAYLESLLGLYLFNKN